eukprot:Nitzschia sp. Nitz4//scaffold81_size91200//51716//54214//NITZ4_004988-RA/size91200-snap-gene-0.31-mRNA-1//-1//CDS//3329558716//8446//frame0
MAGRLPFNLQGSPGQNPLQDPQIRAALGLGQVDDSLYLQQQRDIQRDFRLRQLLLQDQIGQQSRLDSMAAEQRLKQIREQLQEMPDLQHQYSLLLRDHLQREQGTETSFLSPQQQSAIAQLLQSAAGAQSSPSTQPQQPQVSETAAAPSNSSSASSRDIAADSLAGNAVKRHDTEKRVFANPEEEVAASNQKRKQSIDSGDGERKKRRKKDKHAKKTESLAADTKLSPSQETHLKPSIQALLDFAVSAKGETAAAESKTSPQLATLEHLLQAVESEKKVDEAVSVLSLIKKNAEWPESEQEDEDESERRIAIKKGDSVLFPNFTSILPQLPEEPELVADAPKKKKKYKGLMDDDSVDQSASKQKSDSKSPKVAKKSTRPSESAILNYPYPVDTWWPSVAAIRKERKAAGVPLDEDDFEDSDDPQYDGPFRANVPKIKERLANMAAPGVLEKVPHCRIHQMCLKKKKNPSSPELVYCFQVTELYPNDVMVCCSQCGTWRHAACGGHHKPYSVRECIDTPFTAVCDRCHQEESFLRDDPVVKKRIDRQRTEQIRRGLASSAVMRHASFSKHGGTYKWPLGSVSATHIGGHTRSVHHRHDKAEKQWMEMIQRLSRNGDKRSKDRMRTRTKELEKLLVSIEDAEGHTDRHNMMLFLLQDTMKEHPIGFEKQRRNIFDPEEGGMPSDPADNADGDPSARGMEVDIGALAENSARLDQYQEELYAEEDSPPKATACARQGCTQKPRFDSMFCSDSCGVACLESDLLRTFQYTSDMHPSLLRS